MAFGADNVKAAGVDDLLMQLLPFGAHFDYTRILGFLGKVGIIADLVYLGFGVSAQHDVGTPACHVRGDRHHFGPAGLGDNFRLACMLFCIQHLMRKFFLLQQFGQEFGVFN